MLYIKNILLLLLVLNDKIVDSKNNRKEILIFEENFNELDFNIWDHEITLSGGGTMNFNII